MGGQTIVAKCRGCGREFTPSRADFITGNWRTCPECRERKRQDDTPAVDARVRPRPAAKGGER